MKLAALLTWSIVLVVASGASAPAQDQRPYESVTESERLYDKDRTETIHGVIADIEIVSLEHDAPFMQLQLKTSETEPVRVHLAPEWFMREQIQRLELDIGRQFEIVGSKSVVKGQPVFIAAEIKNDRREQRLRLRHPDGTPVWASSERVS